MSGENILQIESGDHLTLPRVKLSSTNNKIINDDDTVGAAAAIIDIDNHIQTLKSNKQQAKSIVDSVRRVFHQTGKTKPLKFRKKQLSNLLKFLVDNETQLAEAVHKDLKRHKHETVLFETELVANDIRHLLINLDKYGRPSEPEKPLVNFFDGAYVYHEPYGVVLIIGAWNYPLLITLGPLVGAIAAGNCVILKPSELCPATSQLLADLLPHYLDPECYRLILGGIAETTELLKERFDYIFYTGSATVGRIIHTAANKHLTPITLELGGKSPAYIDHTADMEKTARRLIWGKCVNAGQTCVAPDYILCTKQVQEKFVGFAAKILHEFYGDDPRQTDNFGRILNERHFNRLVELLKNLNIAVGGQFDRKELYVAPTIAVDVSAQDPVMTEEVFGPILPIVVVKDVDEAISFINDREKPLAVYIFTTNNKDRDLLVANTSSGGVTVNDTILHASIDCLPFGGVGMSGMGAYHGRMSFETFSHQKSVLVKDFNALLEKAYSARYPPYTDFKLKFAKKSMKRRRQIPQSYVTHLIGFLLGIVLAVAFYFVNKTFNFV